VRAFLVPLAALAVVACAAPSGPPAGPEPGSVVVVRHAEKVRDGSPDPALTPEGERRAVELDRVLSDVDVAGLIATPTRRTRGTLAPIARRTGVAVTEVGRDADPIADVAAAARAAAAGGGVVVVAGHSDTVPGIVATLSGAPVGPIADDAYDDLFVVFRPGRADAAVVHLRYGAASPSGSLAPNESERADSVR